MLKYGLGAVVAIGLAAAATPSLAAGLELKDVVARVVVVTEPRSDVSVTVLRTNPTVPLTITRNGDDVIVTGRKDSWWARTFGGQSLSCHVGPGGRHVSALGVGAFAEDQLPSLLVRMPLAATIRTSGAIVGSLPSADSVDLHIAGCDAWTIGKVKGALSVEDAGAGRVLAGEAGSLSGQISGMGEVRVRAVDNGLRLGLAGMGTLTAGRASGPIDMQISGRGNITIAGGQAATLKIEITGQGEVTYGGVAGSLDAIIAGQGDIHVAKVTGEVEKQVAGLGTISIGDVDPRVATAQADLTKHW